MLKLNPDTLEFAPGEREQLLRDMETFHIKPTRFGFVNDHFGFKPGQRHVLLGTSGTGKSTLARSLLLDAAKNHNVLVYSSEEDAKATKEMLALRDTDEKDLVRVSFVYERDYLAAMKSKDIESWIKRTELKLRNSQAEIFFFDNITTSQFYDGREYPHQCDYLEAVDTLFYNLNLPYIVVAHTKNGIKDDQQSLIGPDDVKGPKTLTGKAQYLYVYQKFTGKTSGLVDPTYGIVRVIKARGKGNIGSTYLLDYDFEKREYYGDMKIGFSEFNKIYSSRAKLGARD